MLDALAKSQAQAPSTDFGRSQRSSHTIGQFGQFDELAEEQEEDDVPMTSATNLHPKI